MSKPKSLRKNVSKKRTLEQTFPPTSPAQVLDEDEVFKTFFTKNVPDVIAIVNPELFVAVDWSVAVEFCEQELINFLRGRLRQIDKRKVADKLLKLKLLNGNDVFVFLHNEFQNALTDDLAQRWFKSRMLISLRYNVEDITTIIIFTGDAPKKKHSFYDRTCFGTRTTFKTNAFVVVKQNAKQLMAMNNPAAFAFLAAKYAVQSKDDVGKRLFLKKKLFDLVKKKGFPVENMEEILTFVFDFMMLPAKMDAEFMLNESFFQHPKSEKIMMTLGKAVVSNAMCLNITGLTFNEYIEFRDAQLETATNAAKEAATIAATIAAKEAAKEATKEVSKQKDIAVIQALLEDGFPIERIARILKIEVSYANELATLNA
jgi:hypothetical protein